jgi:3-isopropylmalate dehydratase small subunit
MAKAHVYKRDHVNTDEIIPARYLNTDDTPNWPGTAWKIWTRTLSRNASPAM